jgi:hypothetical protein
MPSLQHCHAQQYNTVSFKSRFARYFHAAVHAVECEARSYERSAVAHIDPACMQEAENNACVSPFSHRIRISDIPLSDRLRHVQGALWHLTVSRTETGTFTQTAFSPLLATEDDRRDALHDCMRMHASMWSSTSVSKSACLHDSLRRTLLLCEPCALPSLLPP